MRAWFDAKHGPGYVDQLVEELRAHYPHMSRDDIWRHALPALMEPVPKPMPTFERFWNCCTEPRGLNGPARAVWAKLTDMEREAIGDLCFLETIDTGGCWVVTWLKARGWEGPPPPRSVMLAPYSDEWNRERARLISIGDRGSVRFMEDQAEKGTGWSVAHERH